MGEQYSRPTLDAMYELALLAIWRVGRKVGRTVYAQLTSEPSDGDILIGVFDTRELAYAAVQAHNRYVESGV